jgi:hypothetical protein
MGLWLAYPSDLAMSCSFVVPLRRNTTTCFSRASSRAVKSSHIRLSVYSLRALWTGRVSRSSTKETRTFDLFAYSLRSKSSQAKDQRGEKSSTTRLDLTASISARNRPSRSAASTIFRVTEAASPSPIQMIPPFRGRSKATSGS